MSVRSACLVPAAPVLLPELCGSTRPIADVRQCVLDVLGDLSRRRPDRIVLIAEGNSTTAYPATMPLGLHRLGGMATRDRTAQVFLPVSLAVGLRLLQMAGWQGQTLVQAIEGSLAGPEVLQIGRGISQDAEETAVVLLGNASARSTEKAPGSLHAGAEHFNAEVARMVASGDRDAMIAMTAEEAGDQLSDIRIGLQILAGLGPELPSGADLVRTYEVNGVCYVIAAFREVAHETPANVPLTTADPS